MIRPPKYTAVIKDLDKIIERLLTKEITISGVAIEYKATRSFIVYHVNKRATITQLGIIAKRGPKVAGRKRRGVANDPSGGERVQSKIKAFAKIYSDPLSPVKHKILRTRVANKSKLTTYEVQTKGADGKWYTIDTPDSEDAAVLLLGRLYCYDLITQADYNEKECV